MKYFIVKKNEELHIIGSSKHPKGYDLVIARPAELKDEKACDIDIIDQENEFGEIIKVPVLNESRKAERIAAEQAQLDATQYIRDRQAAYPSIADQMDMRYWDEIDGTTVWKDTIAAIKAQYPKP